MFEVKPPTKNAPNGFIISDKKKHFLIIKWKKITPLCTTQKKNISQFVNDGGIGSNWQRLLLRMFWVLLQSNNDLINIVFLILTNDLPDQLSFNHHLSLSVQEV